MLYEDPISTSYVDPSLADYGTQLAQLDAFGPEGPSDKPMNPTITQLDGYSTTETYRNGSTTVTEYFDSGGWWMGTSYNYDSGGGSWHTSDGHSGSWSGNTGYWEIGGALGIGLGLWGTGDGDWGIAWNVGVGGYALVGDADDVEAAIETVTNEEVVIGVEINGVPTHVQINTSTGEVEVPDMGFKFGFFATSPDR